MTYATAIARALEDSEGDEDVIVKREDLLGFGKEMAEHAEVGATLKEAMQAARTAQIHPRMLMILRETWKSIVMPPNFSSMSDVGFDQLARQALASAKALMPTSCAMPSDGIIQTAQMAMLLRLLDVCRAK